ncbi:hypothetical protein EV424DRAFT_1437617 [Suillus variegatus]|nr:hypothetical protein EV424DRAFT_1437617 [Suillus variegatus]
MGISVSPSRKAGCRSGCIGFTIPGSLCGHIHLTSTTILTRLSACKTAFARYITAVIPCFPYAHMDKKDEPRAPITTLMANMLARVSYIRRHIDEWQNGIAVSPDAGGVKRITAMADKLSIEFALIHRKRDGNLKMPQS